MTTELEQLSSELATLQDAFLALQTVVERLENRVAALERPDDDDPIRDAFVEGFEEGR